MADTPNVWQKNLHFILACVGAAVGLGNLWRFPYMAYKHGGSAFLIPYLVCVLLVGLPLMLLEFGIGRWGGGSVAKGFNKAGKRYHWIGWWIAELNGDRALLLCRARLVCTICSV